jgi:hypothetical protein
MILLLLIYTRYITSDCDAVADIYEAQNYSKTSEEAVAYVLKAGTHALDKKLGSK